MKVPKSRFYWDCSFKVEAALPPKDGLSDFMKFKVTHYKKQYSSRLPRYQDNNCKQKLHMIQTISTSNVKSHQLKMLACGKIKKKLTPHYKRAVLQKYMWTRKILIQVLWYVTVRFVQELMSHAFYIWAYMTKSIWISLVQKCIK